MTLPRFGPRVLIASGMLLGAAAMAYLTQLTVTSSYASGVLPAMLVLGLGFGMIFAPAINTATAGVRREDSGVASALVNTMQQVGGSIGTSALSTVALTATASYLAAHHASALAPAIAATHGYTVAFAVSAALLGLGVILAVVLLPSKARLSRAQERSRHGRRARPRATARDARDSRSPRQLLAGDNPRFRIGGHAGPVEVAAERTDPTTLARVPDSPIISAINAAWTAAHPGAKALVIFSTDDDGMLLWLSDRSQAAADFVKQYLLTHSAAGNNVSGNPVTVSASGLKAVYAGAATAAFFGVPASDPRHPDVLGIAQHGVVYTGGKAKIAEHGGDDPQDRNVPVLGCRPA